MKSQILKKQQKKWWNCGITNTNIKQNYQELRYLFCCHYEQSSQNNQCTWCKASHEETKTFFGKKIMGSLVCSLED